MSEQAKTSLGKKILKAVAIILASLLGLLLIAAILLLTFLEPYAERYLEKQISERTGGLYSLQFEDLDINILANTVTFSQLHLYPDTSVHRRQKEQGEASPFLLELQTPRLEISQIGLVEILFNNHLDVKAITVEKSELGILYDKEVEPSKNEGSSFIDSFYIGEIDILDATVRHQVLGDSLALRQLIPNVSLRVLALTTDSLEQANYSRPFKADDIQVKVDDYLFISPDSVYTLKVGQFSYSTKTEELRAEAVEVIPDNQTNLALEKDNINRSLYGIKAPLLSITGLDLIEVYRTRRFEVEEILLDKALVEIFENNNIPAKAKFPELTDLYSNVSSFLIEISIDDLRVDDGALIYRSKIEDIFISHELENADINLQQVGIDSTILFSPNDNFYAEEILISTRAYTYKHPHSPYTIKASSLDLSTIENYITADSVQIIGDWDKNDQLKQIGKAHYIIYNMFAEQLSFTDMDLTRALQTQKLDIGQIAVKEPFVDLLRDQEVEKAAYGNWLQDTYRNISGFVKEVAVKEISFDEASFTQHIRNKRSAKLVQKLEQASLLATGLYVDSMFIFHSAAKLPLDELRLSARDYTYWLPDNIHTFHLNSLRYGTRSKELNARSVSFSAETDLTHNTPSGSALKDRYDLKASLFKVTGLDFIRAINIEKLALDEIILRNPQVAIYQDKNVTEQSSDEEQSAQSVPLKGLFELVNPIQVNAIRLEDGNFVLRQKQEEVTRTQLLEHVTLNLLGVYLTPDQLQNLDESLPVQEIRLTASDYTYRSPNGIYTITLDSLQYSSTNQILTARLFNVDADVEAHERIKLEQPAEANRNLFDISTRKFTITGLDLVKAYDSDRFIMDGMLLNDPEVTIIQDQNVPNQQTEEEAAQQQIDDQATVDQVAEIVDAFRIKNLRIRDGLFKVSVLKDTIRRSQVIEQVSVNIEQFRLASLEASDPLEMFDVDEIEVQVPDYTYLLPDSLYRIEVAKVSTSLRNETLTIDSLRVIPLYDKDKFNEQIEFEKDRIKIKTPKIRMLGMDLAALYNEQNFIAREVQVLDPLINIYRDKRVPMDPERRPKTLQAALLEADMLISVDTVKILSGRLTYSEVPLRQKVGTVVIHDTYITISNVTNDSLEITRNPIALADGVTQFMEEGELRVVFTFHLDHPEDYHTYEGSLKPMNFEAFNPILTKLMFVRVESGFINEAQFSVEATKHLAEGSMQFLYENLDVQLLDKDDLKNPGFVENAGSWVVNNLVIKSNNPGRLGNYRKGPIDVPRDYQKSIFNLMSSAMMDGIASALMPKLVEKIINAFTEIP